MKIEWETPPEAALRKAGRPPIERPVLDELIAHPGKWAKVSEEPTKAAASRRVKRLRGHLNVLRSRGHVSNDGRLQTAYDKEPQENGLFRTYCRYVTPDGTSVVTDSDNSKKRGSKPEADQ